MQAKMNTGMWPLSNSRVSSIRRIDLKGRGGRTQKGPVVFLGEEFCVSFPEVVNSTCSLHSTISMVLAFLEDIFPTMFPTVIPKENEYILINGENNSGHLFC